MPLIKKFFDQALKCPLSWSHDDKVVNKRFVLFIEPILFLLPCIGVFAKALVRFLRVNLRSLSSASEYDLPWFAFHHDLLINMNL